MRPYSIISRALLLTRKHRNRHRLREREGERQRVAKAAD